MIRLLLWLLGGLLLGGIVHLATVLLLPSRSEGLPRVIIEAACRGRAVVAGQQDGT